MVEILNAYFVFVFTVDNTNGTEVMSPLQTRVITLKTCDCPEDTIIRVSNYIRANKKPLPKCIAPLLLKEDKHQYCEHLSITFDK